MKALIIDDDQIVITLVTAMLSSKGYEVSAVNSELNVGALVEQEELNFELVLIDLQLGEASGLYIYENYLSSSIALDNIIFMSANSIRDARELYLLPDEAKFLEKPFKAPDLFNLI